MENKNITISKILRVLKKYDGKSDQNPDWSLIESNITSSVLNGKPLTLVSFTCSTINAQYLYNQDSPELYVSTDPLGNNLKADLPRLKKLYKELTKLSSVKIVILIGNTDPFYIYTQQASIYTKITQRIFWMRFNKRWISYKENLKKYLDSELTGVNLEIVSWYELEKEWEEDGWNFLYAFEKTKMNLNKYFSNSEMNWEFGKLKEAFVAGMYFGDLERPPSPILRDWVKRKFAQYAVQGLWIKQIFPNAILLQNEKPSDLRTRMYQPLIEERLNSRLPVLYPFGVDNSGFQ